MSKILKNTTGSPITLSDVGITIPASSNYTANPGEYFLLSASTQLQTAIQAGSVVVNDGYDDLKPVNGLRHVQEEGMPRPSAFIATVESIVTSNSTWTMSAASRLIYLFSGSTAGQIMKLGDARTYNIGHKYEFWNTSTNQVLIQNNAGTNIFIVAVQQKSWATLQDNSTQAGTWIFDSNFMGSGSGGGNALMMFGFDGNAATGRWLENFTNIASNLTGVVIAAGKTIRAMSCAAAAGSTYNSTFTIYKNGAAIDTIQLVNQRKNSKLNLSHVLVDLDELSVQQTAGSTTRPICILWV